MISLFSNKQRLLLHFNLYKFWLLQTSSIYIFNIVCPYIVDWSMRDEMSGMPKNTFDAIEVIVRYVSHSVQCGVSNMWHYNAILTNLDPFHTIEQKRHPISMAIDFIKCYIYDERSFTTLHQFSLLFCQMTKLFCENINLNQRLTEFVIVNHLKVT